MEVQDPRTAAASRVPPTISGILERRPLDLRPWPNNPRKHSEKQLVKLKASIRKFGFTIPVLVDETGMILSGHGRVTAAVELGLASIPTLEILGLRQADKRAYVIADNKLAMLSAWDPNLLKGELALLIEEDFEIEATGFSTAEVDLMFEEPGGDQDADDLVSEDVVTEAVTQQGDLWTMGDHRLLCGHSLNADSYATVMQTDVAQMVITDPPYNVPIAGQVCNSGKIQHREFAMAAGEMSSEQFTGFLQTALTRMAAVSHDGAICFVFMDWRHSLELLHAAKPVFGAPRQLNVWVKDNAGMGSFYRSQHELIYVFKNGAAPHINNFELGQHGRYRTNVWSYPGVASFKGQALLALHPTVKPAALIADAIRDCSRRQGVVLDPFAGSGTILVAAERTGRHARAIELDPRYVDVAINRWQRVSGKRAVLSATGLSWDEVREQRRHTSAPEASA